MSRQHSSRAIARTATRAAWRSLRSGFDRVDPATYERRLDACDACEFAVDPPSTLLHTLAAGPGSPVCDLCGCTLHKKARYTTEQCPSPSPHDPSLSRWGEPLDRSAPRERRSRS